MLSSFIGGPGAGIEGHFMDRTIKHRRIGPEDVLGAVAVMHVPVEDRHPRGTVLPLCMASRDRGVVKKQNPMARLRSA